MRIANVKTTDTFCNWRIAVDNKLLCPSSINHNPWSAVNFISRWSALGQLHSFCNALHKRCLWGFRYRSLNFRKSAEHVLKRDTEQHEKRRAERRKHKHFWRDWFCRVWNLEIMLTFSSLSHCTHNCNTVTNMWRKNALLKMDHAQQRGYSLQHLPDWWFCCAVHAQLCHTVQGSQQLCTCREFKMHWDGDKHNDKYILADRRKLNCNVSAKCWGSKQESPQYLHSKFST